LTTEPLYIAKKLVEKAMDALEKEGIHKGALYGIMKVLLFCNKGFETMEFSPFIDTFGWAGFDFHYDVSVTTCGFTKQVISTFHVPVVMDKTIDEISASHYDALAIPGGYEEFGFYEEAFDERFLQLIRDFDSRKKPIASICVGALPIGKSGILNGRRGTTYHLGDGCRQKQLAGFGVNVINEPVVIDDNVITSYCPETGPAVAFELMRMLLGEEKTKKVRNAMGY